MNESSIDVQPLESFVFCFFKSLSQKTNLGEKEAGGCGLRPHSVGRAVGTDGGYVNICISFITLVSMVLSRVDM